MDPASIGLLVTLVVLIILSAFFSASETAFSSLNRLKIKNIASAGDKRAALVLKFIKNYDKLLSSVLIGNNIVNITASSLATVLFVGLLGNAGVTISTFLMTFFVLIIGEISPKTIAKEIPERFALFAAPFFNFFIVLLSPVNRFMTIWKAWIMKLFKVSIDRSVTEAELLTFVEEVRQEGGINEREEDMIKSAIKFDDRTARDVFTPRIDVAAVSANDSIDAIAAMFHKTGFSRLPVYEGSIDDIKGVVLLKDFHEAFVNRQGGFTVADVVKPVVYVTESIKIARLLRILQTKRSHLAVVVDEFGGTRGIVTVEDIIEELVGEIWDEHDEIVEKVVQIGENRWKIRGDASLEDAVGVLSIATARRTTMANWIMETFFLTSGVPKAGDGFDFNGFRFTITKTKKQRILEVEVEKRGGGGNPIK
ncbi:MAG: hemolysin family protein [Treponema sp.]|jgi:CBS domain containing-hemolysin-like protein|nr:hemolysin family protein [Treponema sp.]